MYLLKRKQISSRSTEPLVTLTIHIKWSRIVSYLIQLITIIMFSSVSVLLVCAGSLLAQDCPLPPPSVCTNGDITCDMGVGSDGCWLGDYCMPAGSVCPPPTTACFMPPPSTCADGDILCDMGVGTDGCWMGDYCMPAGSECPPPVTTTECVPPPPAGPCAEEGELLCSMGSDDNGCYMGDICIFCDEEPCFCPEY